MCTSWFARPWLQRMTPNPFLALHRIGAASLPRSVLISAMISKWLFTEIADMMVGCFCSELASSTYPKQTSPQTLVPSKNRTLKITSFRALLLLFLEFSFSSVTVCLCGYLFHISCYPRDLSMGGCLLVGVVIDWVFVLWPLGPFCFVDRCRQAPWCLGHCWSADEDDAITHTHSKLMLS